MAAPQPQTWSPKNMDTSTQPSLLRQIIDEVDELAIDKKEELLWKLKMDKALLLSQTADEILKDKFLDLTDAEITNMVSENRKTDYEAKIRD